MEKIIKRRQTPNNKLFSKSMHPVLQRIYMARGIHNPDEIEYGLDKLIPFTQLKNIDAAVDCIYQHIKAHNKIVIIGDFDTDGATSSAVAVHVLRLFGNKDVAFLVPNRFEYGYGLTPEIVDVASQWKPNLIITVDNGISSIEGVQHAKSLGIDVVITDHHLAGNTLPEANAIVNPNQPGDEFPSKNLAGVGVIFYVMMALRSYLREKNWFGENNIPEPNIGQLLDLVALGTVADVVPLDQNNRILVQQGLQRIRAGKCRPGIEAILQIAKRRTQNIVAADFGFAIAPRLNAAGRLDDMSLGIDCLLTENTEKAHIMAQQLDELNHERRQIESDMKKQAFNDLNKLQVDDKSSSLPLGVCVFDENWHQGVIGILASRIKDKLHRPVIAFACVNNDEIKGSARSIPNLHIRDILDTIATKNPGLVSKFGGHAMAAGLSLKKANYKKFTEAFINEVEKQLDGDNLQRLVLTDGELSETELTLELADILRSAGPWGQGFPAPVFDGVFSVAQQRLVGNKHLKITLAHGDKYIDAIAFNIDIDKWPNYRAKKLAIVYRLDVNEYNGLRNLQLIIEEIQPA